MVNNGPVAVALKLGGTLGGSAGLQALIDAIVGKSGSTVDDVPAALLALAAGGDPGAVAALVQAAVDGLDLSGLLDPRVQQMLDAFAQQPAGTVDDLTTYLDSVDNTLGALTAESAATSAALRQFLGAVAGPGSAPVNVVADAVAAWEALKAQVEAGGAACPVDEDAVNALIAAAVAALPAGSTDLDEDAVNALIADALAALPAGADIQPLLDLLAVKPGATVDDVAEVWEALSNTSVGFAQLLATLSGKPLSEDPTVADVQAGLPVLIQAIVDQGVPGKIDAAIDVSVTSGAIGAAIGGLYSQLYNDDIVPLKTAVEQGFPYVQGELDKQGGRLTALEAAALAGGGVSEAVVDSLLARLDALEAENSALKLQVLSLDQNMTYAISEVDRLQTQDEEILGYVVEKCAEKDELQGVRDAINGPDATDQSVKEMFWLLNDVLTALIEATGIELPGKVN